MILPNNTTVAVVDGEKLRMFRNLAPEPHIRLAPVGVPALHGDNRGTGGRHRSVSANPDEARLAEDNFAAAAADYINRQVIGGQIESLFVVADPRTLGEVRRNLHVEAKSKMVGDLAKDLTGHSVEAIETALANV